MSEVKLRWQGRALDVWVSIEDPSYCNGCEKELEANYAISKQ